MYLNDFFRTLLWAFPLLMIPNVTMADDTVFVLLDNSTALQDLTRTYHNDVLQILKGSHDRVLVAPIGDTTASVIIDTRDSSHQWSGLVERIFPFDKTIIHLDDSLNVVEEDPKLFKKLDRIILVSGMAPNFDNTGTWRFGANDLEDVKKFLDRLERWIGKHRKELVVALHGWDAVPRISTGLSSLPMRLLERIEELRTNPEKLESEESRELVAEGLLNLSTRYPQRVKLLAIPKQINGVRNEEGMRDLLCAELRVSDPEICPSAGEDKVKFVMRLDFDPRILFPSELRSRLETTGDRQVNVGPTRSIKLTEIREEDSDAHDPTFDFHFRVKGGSKGKPFYHPIFMGTVRKANGGIASLKTPIQPERRLNSQEHVLRWVSGAIDKSLLSLIYQHFPPKTKSKKVFVTERNGKPVPSGYRIEVECQYGSGSKPFKRAMPTLGSQPINMELPTSFDNGRIYLKPRFFRDRQGEYESWVNESADRDRITLRRLSQRDVRKSSHIRVKVDPSMMGQIEVSVDSSVSAEVVWSVYLKTPGGAHPGPWRKLGVGHAETVPLLPGSYFWEAVPVQAPGLLAKWDGNLDISHEHPQRERIRIKLSADRLSHEKNWTSVLEELFPLDRLTAEGKHIVSGSSYFLQALFRYSSEQIAIGNQEKIKFMWSIISLELFDENRQGTMKRRLRRGMEAVNLIDRKSGSLHDHAYIFLRAAFNFFLEEGDQTLLFDSRRGQELREEYNTWLSRITDSKAKRRWMSKDLQELLEAK